MSRKDYEKAALIVQRAAQLHVGDEPVEGYADRETHELLADAFVEFFAADNPRFDEHRFRAACLPGANVKARRAA